MDNEHSASGAGILPSPEAISEAKRIHEVAQGKLKGCEWDVEYLQLRVDIEDFEKFGKIVGSKEKIKEFKERLEKLKDSKKGLYNPGTSSIFVSMEPLHTVSGASGAPVVIGDEEEVKQEIIRVRAANVELAKVNAEFEGLRTQLADRQAGPGGSGGSDGVNPGGGAGGGLPKWYDPAKHVIDMEEPSDDVWRINGELGDENKRLVEALRALNKVVIQDRETIAKQQEEIRKLKEHANSIVKVIAEGKAIADSIPEIELEKIDARTRGLDDLPGPRMSVKDRLALRRKQREEEEGKQQSGERPAEKSEIEAKLAESEETVAGQKEEIRKLETELNAERKNSEQLARSCSRLSERIRELEADAAEAKKIADETKEKMTKDIEYMRSVRETVVLTPPEVGSIDDISMPDLDDLPPMMSPEERKKKARENMLRARAQKGKQQSGERPAEKSEIEAKLAESEETVAGQKGEIRKLETALVASQGEANQPGRGVQELEKQIEAMNKKSSDVAKHTDEILKNVRALPKIESQTIRTDVLYNIDAFSGPAPVVDDSED